MWIRELSKIVQGKRCIIVGSAPNPIFPKNIEDGDVVICVKASAYVADKVGIEPDVVFTASWGFSETVAWISGLRAKLLLHVAAGECDEAYVREAFEKVQFKFDDFYLIPDPHLAAFYMSPIFNGIRTSMPMSYGVGVMLMCINLGAAEIVLVGINPGTVGRSYAGKRPTLDCHEIPDVAAITTINKTYGNVSTLDEGVANRLGIKYLNPHPSAKKLSIF